MARFLIITFIILIGLSGCQEEEARETAPSAVPVELATVDEREFPEIIQGIGTIETPENAQVAAKASGEITDIYFEQGQRVDKGDLLFTIENEKAQQTLNARQAALDEAQIELENARRFYERRQELLAEELVSREVVDEAKTAMERAQARVRVIKAEIRRLRDALQDTRIVAPIAGTAGEREVDKGDFVDIGDPLVTIVDTRDLEVAFSVPERYLGQVAPGQPVTVRTPAWPEQTFPGEIFFVSPRIREVTRDLQLKANVRDEENRLVPGAFVSVDILVEMHEGALIIPEEALVPTRTGYLVFVVKEGTAHKREVQIGLRRPGIVQIREGLKAGETVIREGHMEVSEGTPVQTREMEESQAPEEEAS